MQLKPITEKGLKIAPLIDHTLLNPDVTLEKVINLCKEARYYGFASICIPPSMVYIASRELKNSSVKTCTVIGFPMGFTTPEVKGFEAADAVINGADEVDMVISVAMLKDCNYNFVLNEIEIVVRAADQRTVKVIIETCLLTNEEIVKASELTMEAGAHFVKTSTGFAGGGAEVSDIRIMREVVGAEFGVKASGGIRTIEDAEAMIDAGASRIGTSSGITIVT